MVNSESNTIKSIKDMDPLSIVLLLEIGKRIMETGYFPLIILWKRFHDEFIGTYQENPEYSFYEKEISEYKEYVNDYLNKIEYSERAYNFSKADNMLFKDVFSSNLKSTKENHSSDLSNLSLNLDYSVNKVHRMNKEISDMNNDIKKSINDSRDFLSKRKRK